MDNIKLSAVFDDLSQAESAASLLKHKIRNISSIKLNSKKTKNVVNNDRITLLPEYSATSSIFGGSSFSYIGSTGPMSPGFSLNNNVPSEFKGLDFSYKKTKLLATLDKNSESLASTLILSCGGYNIHIN